MTQPGDLVDHERCPITFDGQRCYAAVGHAGDHFASDSMRYTVMCKPTAGERPSDDRLAWLAADRTGFRLKFFTDGISTDEQLGIIDELRAWRKHKLTDEEKENLRALHQACAASHEEHFAAAFTAIGRIAGGGK